MVWYLPNLMDKNYNPTYMTDKKPNVIVPSKGRVFNISKVLKGKNWLFFCSNL